MLNGSLDPYTFMLYKIHLNIFYKKNLVWKIGNKKKQNFNKSIFKNSNFMIFFTPSINCCFIFLIQGLTLIVQTYKPLNGLSEISQCH